MKRKILCYVIVLVCALTLCVNAVSASNVGYDISYWYSNVDEMGTWSNMTIDVYVGSNSTHSSLSPSNLKNYLNTVETSWACTDVDFNYVSQQNSADLVYGGITRAEATSLGVPTNVLGFTVPDYTTQLATLYYGSAEKRLYRIDSATVFLVESSQANTTTGARKLAVHEMGHALGYFGHYNNGTVMTTYYENMTSLTPSTAERNHLGQMH